MEENILPSDQLEIANSLKPIKKKKFNWGIIVIIVISIFCGSISGLIALFLLISGSIPFLSSYDIDNRNAERIIIDQPRNVVIQQDVQIKQLENVLLPALINLYPKLKAVQGYADSNFLGQGIVLTSDGWIITTQNSVSNASTTYQAIGYQLKEYDFNPVVTDKATNIVFGKIDAKNLPVVGIGKSKDLSLGQTVVVVSKRSKMEIANIVKIGYKFDTEKEINQNSDTFSKRIYLNIKFNKEYNGAIVANMKGEVVGIIVNDEIIPADYFARTINDVLVGKKISRPELGINYKDISATEGLQKYAEKGAYVVDVLKTSDAYGKILAGDIIKKVNDYELNSFMSLSEAINNFNTGNKVEILISRAGKDQSFNIILK